MMTLCKLSNVEVGKTVWLAVGGQIRKGTVVQQRVRQRRRWDKEKREWTAFIYYSTTVWHEVDREYGYRYAWREQVKITHINSNNKIVLTEDQGETPVVGASTANLSTGAA